MMSRGDFFPFLTRKISGAFLLISLGVILWPGIAGLIRQIKVKNQGSTV
jgi:TctA family transporter